MTHKEIHDATARLAIEYGVPLHSVSVTTHVEGYGATSRVHFRVAADPAFGTGDSAEQALHDLRKRLEWWKRQDEARQANRPQTDAERRLALLGEIA